MPVIKNKHLLWAASLCSAGGVLVGAGAVLDRSRMAAELEGLKASLSRADTETRQALQDLKSRTDGSLKELGESIAKRGDVHKKDSDKVASVSIQAEETRANLALLSDRVRDMKGDLASISDRAKKTEEVITSVFDRLKRTEEVFSSVSDRLKKTEDELVAISERLRKREDEFASIRSAMRDRGGDLKALSEALAPLVEKPWRPDLKDLNQPLADSVQRIEKQLKQLEEQQKKLVEESRMDPKEKASAKDKKADK